MQPNQGYIKTGSATRFVVALVMVLLVAVSSNAQCVLEQTKQVGYNQTLIAGTLAPSCLPQSKNGTLYNCVCYDNNPSRCSSCTSGALSRCLARSVERVVGDQYSGTCYVDCYSGCTQDQLDSISCVSNPSADGCVVEKDTTIIACNENLAPDGSTYSQIYNCSCKAENGQLKSCGGSTSVVPARDCRLISEKQGSCSKNGYQVGANSAEHTNVGECYAVVGSRCYFEDPTTKNTFSCECDGSCSYGMAQLATGRCQNPYIRSSSSTGDTLNFSSASVGSSSSSGAENPQSSGSEGAGSSGSGSGSGADSTGDLEYDYYNELGNIIANTQLINANLSQLNTTASTANGHLESIDNKMTTNNSLLQTIANKDFSPQVNVNVSGDTAKSPAKMYELLHGVVDSGEVDTNELLGGLNIGRLQNEQDSLERFWDNKTDIFANCDTTGGKDCSNIFGLDSSRTNQELRTAFNSLMDTLQNGAFGDSVKKWQSYLLPSALSGSGSNTCPAILQKSFPVAIGGISFTIPSLGSTGLCGTMIGGLTFWAFVRLLLRLFVGFACLFAVYRCVVGLGEDK